MFVGVLVTLTAWRASESEFESWYTVFLFILIMSSSGRQMRSNSLKSNGPVSGNQGSGSPLSSPKVLSLSNIKTVVDESIKTVLENINSLRQDFEQIKLHILSLDSRISGIEHSLTTLTENQEKNKTEVNALKARVEELSCLRNPSVDSIADKVLVEFEEREYRRDNLMVFGLPEISDSLSQRREHDSANLWRMFQMIKVSYNTVIEHHRVGKISSGKIRPLKVKIRDRTAKMEILRKAKDLRVSGDFKKVFIGNDMTKRQQEQYQTLKKELLKQRDDGKDVVIYKGEIRTRDSIKREKENFQGQF